MAVRDDVRQLATKKAQAFTPDPNLTPVAPTEFVGNRTPDARKPNKGLKRFIVGPGGDYGDLADPSWWAKGLGREAKKNFYDPSKRFAAAVDPNSGASVADRIAGVGEGVLYAADLLTLGVPEQALYREAMEKALDREVAGYAASGGGAKYRGNLIMHGSPEVGLDVIQARKGSYALPDTEAAYGFNMTDILADSFDEPQVSDFRRAVNQMKQYAQGATSVARGGAARDLGSFYVGRVPEGDRIIRQYLPEDSVKIAGDRFDSYIVSSKDVPVLSTSRPKSYSYLGAYEAGPRLPKFEASYPTGEQSFLNESESAAINALMSAPLRPRERKQVQRMLAELLQRNKYDPNNVS